MNKRLKMGGINMNKIIKMFTGLIVILAMAIAVPVVLATQAYDTAMNTVYGTPIGSCGICHINPVGGGPRTDYGNSFAAISNHSSDPEGALRSIGPPPGVTPTPTPTVTITPTPTVTLTVFEDSGAIADDIKPTVDAFRNFLGNNNGVGGTFTSGRREINWDGVPDQFAAPNLLPADFFNKNSPRGAVFATPGQAFQVSANSINPTNTSVLFGNINPALPKIFSTFSPQRLFSALGSNIVEVQFFVPGTNVSATVNGFGAVFTDVNNFGSTKIEYFDVNNKLLFSRIVLPGPTNRKSLSFLGVGFSTPTIFKVRITSGDRILKNPARDTVVMDDFIYGEPQPLK